MSVLLPRRSILLVPFVAMTTVACKRKQGTQVIRSKDGKRELTVPLDWSTTLETNKAAEINCGNRFDETYAMVITEPKEDFANYTLQRYSDLTRGVLVKNLTGGNVTAHFDLTIHERPAVQYEVHGAYNDINLVYIHTCVELVSHYSQVTAWTAQSRIASKRDILTNVIMSFKENA